MSQLVLWVKKLAVFMILSGYMEHLLPGSYRRYFHMCMGLVLILMISTPLMSFLKSSGSIDLYYLLEDLKTGSSVYQSDSEAVQNYKDYYMHQYKAALETQIRQIINEQGGTVLSVSMEIEEEQNSSQYGQVQQLALTIQSQENEDNTGAVRTIRQVLSDQLGLAESRIQIQIEE